MLGFLNKYFDLNKKEVDRLRGLVNEVNSLEKKYVKLEDRDDFVAKTAFFKKQLSNGNTLSDILPDAMALVRQVANITLSLRPFDVQLMAAIAFHEGKVAEQKTGEGKTLSAVPALYLNALTGRGVHLVTVNDYLARIGAGWNGPIFYNLGLTVGVIIHEQSFIYDPEYSDPTHGDDRLSHLRPVSRREAYAADITYGTNNEFGFDYLRDNMVPDMQYKVQRGHHFAIVDEVDSILIDEARTPLIISAPDTEPTQKYFEFAKLIERLSADTDFVIDEKHKTANLTEHGIKKVENILGLDNLYEKDFSTIKHLENALKAKTLFIKDKDYIIRDNQVVIVDEFTGRLMPGRRWSEGIHQAVEAKESVPIQQESKTMATISFQNYFRMYEKLAGMTGTAATEAEELRKIYKLEVVVVPTNKPMIRIDHPDIVYKTTRAKYTALANQITEIHKTGQPVLVGTTSIEKNEIISELLTHKKIPHQMLNAKNHEKEAQIISEAGHKGAITIATNIAGRGVDIILGGAPPSNPKFVLGKEKLTITEYKKRMVKWQADHDEVVSLGGLYVIGTERHESRRIDNQLRGRSGRQGDPGATKFYLALDDDIMRIFGGDQVAKIMSFLKIPEDEPIEHNMVSKAIEQAQIKVEGFNFDARKNVVEYDDVMNKQREIVYGLRDRVLKDEINDQEIAQKLNDQIVNVIDEYSPKGIMADEVLPISTAIADIIPFDDQSQVRLTEQIGKLGVASEVKKLVSTIISETLSSRKEQVGEGDWNLIIRDSYLRSIDTLWVDHLDAVDDLRSGVGLRGYGQKDPIVEYKREAFTMFERLVSQIDTEFGRRLFRTQRWVPGQAALPPQVIEVKPQFDLPPTPTSNKDFMSAFQSLQKGSVENKNKNIGRNNLCWCGSGKKYKRCHYPN